MNTVIQKIKNLSGRVTEFSRNFYLNKFIPLARKVNAEALRETGIVQTNFLFLYFSWILFISFASIIILSGKNPISLLIPFAIYDLPARENLTPVTIFVSDGDGNLFPTKRRMFFIPDDFKRNLLTVIGEIGQPPFYDSELVSEDSVFAGTLKKLPNLQTAVISTWKIETTGLLIVDLRESTIRDELDSLKFRFNSSVASDEDESDDGHFFKKKQDVSVDKKLADLQKNKLSILNSVFLSIEKSIFGNFANVQSIEFRLEGKKRDYPGLDYKLTETKIRK
ncbi:MAG: hypothetical protein K8R21_00410 [Leptospira sp.]|nr:hypothetical protein [Leptospira sp.]